MRTRLISLLAALAAAMPSAHAQTAKYPERPVRVVVPVPPGGGIDAVARIVAAQFTEQFGQQFIADNRTGAGGTIGSEIVARATPDGHTLLVYGSSYPANAALYKLSYDPVKGMAAVRQGRERPLRPGRQSRDQGRQPAGIHRPAARAARRAQLRLGG